MKQTFLVSGSLHFIGIGGIGMSGIAEVLHALGYQVTGSDKSDNANIQRLKAKGIYITIGHKVENIQGAGVIIISSAISSDNPELAAARAQRIPVIRRAEMLAELMRLKKTICISGTHGKTTTTSLCGALLEAGGFDPTIVNGGIINSYGTNARVGRGEWFVAEADESDGSFLRLPATLAVVTNIDPEHIDHYGNFSNVIRAYEVFIHNLPFYGLAILCHDHEIVREMAERIQDRRKVSYGLTKGADIRAENIRMSAEGALFDIVIATHHPFFTKHTPEELGWRNLENFFLPMYGEHNVQNALVLVAVALELGFSEAVLREALRSFSGVKRRFTKVGEVKGVSIIDDYAHHPTEIKAVLKAAKGAKKGKTIAVIQPHRYSRLQHLFREFVECLGSAESVVLCPIYSAGEPSITGITQELFYEALKQAYPLKEVRMIKTEEELPIIISELAKAGDMVLCMGAGSITHWAYHLPTQLQALACSPEVREEMLYGV